MFPTPFEEVWCSYGRSIPPTTTTMSSFETTIRVLGGLLSSHLLMEDLSSGTGTAKVRFTTVWGIK